MEFFLRLIDPVGNTEKLPCQERSIDRDEILAGKFPFSEHFIDYCSWMEMNSQSCSRNEKTFFLVRLLFDEDL